MAALCGRAGRAGDGNQFSPLTTVQQLDPVYVDVTQSSTEVPARVPEDGTLQRADQDHAAVPLEDGSEYGLPARPVR